MIYGTTTSPALAADISIINTLSDREKAYKARIAELESELEETRKRFKFYQRMWELQVDQYDDLHKEYVKACKDIVHMVATQHF